MDSILIAGAGILGGVVVGALLVMALMRGRITATQGEVQDLKSRLDAAGLELRTAIEAKARAEGQAADRPRLEADLQALRDTNTRLNAHVAELNKGREADAEKIEWAEKNRQQLKETFESLAGKVLQSNSDSFIGRTRDQLQEMIGQLRGDWSTQKVEMQNLVAPLEKSLDSLDKQVRDLEVKREGAYQNLEQQVVNLLETGKQLQSSTMGLTHALRSSSTRGKWGEVQLRRIVEMAGMVEHVSFEEQVGTDAGRPDMLVYLPNQGAVAVDAKTPMQAYLESFDTADESARQGKLVQHARALRSRVKELGDKRYWKSIPNTPDMVVMFVPHDGCLSAAFQIDPDLLEFAVQQKVLPVTPVTFLALLKAIEYGWQQQRVAENAQAIADEGRLLYSRLGTFIEHLGKLRSNLDGSVASFNEVVGSLDSRVLPNARRLKEMGAGSGEIARVEPIEKQTRPVPNLFKS